MQKITPHLGFDNRGGWPIQARFWLAWGVEPGEVGHLPLAYVTLIVPPPPPRVRISLAEETLVEWGLVFLTLTFLGPVLLPMRDFFSMDMRGPFLIAEVYTWRIVNPVLRKAQKVGEP